MPIAFASDDDRVAARLVAADREGEAEREQQRDEAQQRALKDADRLSLGLCPVMEQPPRHEADERRAEQDRDEKQCKLERAEAEEQGGLLDAEQARLSPRTASLPLPESLCLRVPGSRLASSHRSSTTSSRGCEQQMSALPSAGGSTGSGL